MYSWLSNCLVKTDHGIHGSILFMAAVIGFKLIWSVLSSSRCFQIFPRIMNRISISRWVLLQQLWILLMVMHLNVHMTSHGGVTRCWIGWLPTKCHIVNSHSLNFSYILLKMIIVLNVKSSLSFKSRVHYNSKFLEFTVWDFLWYVSSANKHIAMVTKMYTRHLKVQCAKTL